MILGSGFQARGIFITLVLVSGSNLFTAHAAAMLLSATRLADVRYFLKFEYWGTEWIVSLNYPNPLINP